MPDELGFSHAWRNRFDDTVREFITTAAHYIVKDIQEYESQSPEVRSNAEEITPERNQSEFPDNEYNGESSREFSDEQIRRTTRLARDHGFGGFDSGRAQNASYEDTQFFEL